MTPASGVADGCAGRRVAAHSGVLLTVRSHGGVAVCVVLDGPARRAGGLLAVRRRPGGARSTGSRSVSSPMAATVAAWFCLRASARLGAWAPLCGALPRIGAGPRPGPRPHRCGALRQAGRGVLPCQARRYVYRPAVHVRFGVIRTPGVGATGTSSSRTSSRGPCSVRRSRRTVPATAPPARPAGAGCPRRRRRRRAVRRLARRRPRGDRRGRQRPGRPPRPRQLSAVAPEPWRLSRSA